MISLKLLSIYLLFLANLSIIIAAPSPSPNRPAQVSKVRKLLRKEKIFCKSFLNGALPTQSTVTVQVTNSQSLPAPTQTLTSTVTTVDYTSTNIVTDVFLTTQTATTTQLSIVPITIATTYPVVATSSINTEITKTATEKSTITSISIVSTVTNYFPIPTTFTVQQLSTSTITVTATSTSYTTVIKTTTSTSYPYVRRSLPTPASIASNKITSRGIQINKPKSVAGVSDAIIKDACLLLLYGTFSKSPTTKTETCTVTSIPAMVTVSAVPITEHQSTIVTLTSFSTRTSNVIKTEVDLSTTSLTATIPITSTLTLTSTIPVTVKETSTSILSSTATTLIGTTSTFFTTQTQQTIKTETNTISTIVTTTSTSTIVVKATPLTQGYIRVVNSPDAGTIYNNRLLSVIINSGGKLYADYIDSPVSFLLDPVTGYISPRSQPNLVLMSESSPLPKPIRIYDPITGEAGSSFAPLKCQSKDTITCLTSQGHDTFYFCQDREGGFPIEFGHDANAACTPLQLAFIPTK